ncbi:MAG TPA: HAMP domain-containing histidine kinase [Candidatus Fimimorpha faecalis]|uniref:histidine kinase n=1 Tax=Candidatus Fimimorpha faecalis TaxID=2840824 RepID=A0A9D1ECZ2_9FIRM|nr:HAMP domain-containing histidine kinase [Candidatus Fimimorpha faecalis]
MEWSDSFTRDVDIITRLIPLEIVAFLISFIYLIVSAGRRKGSEQIHLSRYDKIPGEVIVFIVVVAGVFFGTSNLFFDFASTVDYVIYMNYYPFNPTELILSIFTILAVLFAEYLFLMIVLMRIVRRRKAGIGYWDTSIFHMLGEKAVCMYDARKEVGRLLLLLIGGIVCFLICSAFASGYGLIAALGVLGMIFIPFLMLKRLIQEAIWRNRIYEGINHIAGGEPGYKINLDGMKSNERKAGEQINNLGEGLQIAVTQATKNERLKSELITNVSHDIKTPLTSIINYVDLIKRENIENEKVKEYIRVLDEKSQRLKHLTEDLVEASKANTGNLNLDMEKIDFMQLIHQTIGEFQDKFEERQLKTVVKLDKSPIWIYADGRRVWRVMENLLQNIYKYAMPQTRVYIESVTTSKKTTVTIKNISENPLNIPASELTERFIRGDVARTTEGSGLGLSIAKSLTELMNGTFELYLDGDLFRVSIGFDRMGVEKEAQKAEEEEKKNTFDWEEFLKKPEQKKDEEVPNSESKTTKKQKITLMSMWKNLAEEAKHLNLKVKK